jgi:hypothetical protein
MFKLGAKVPNDQIYRTFEMIIREPNSDEVLKEGSPVVEHNPDSMLLHINDQLAQWLSTCQGAWDIRDIRSADSKDQTYVYFNREEDYVRYCLHWIT